MFVADDPSDDIFSFVSELARSLLGFADQGTSFLTAGTVPSVSTILTLCTRAVVADFRIRNLAKGGSSLLCFVSHPGQKRWLLPRDHG